MFLLLKKEDFPKRKYILVSTIIVLCFFVLWVRNNRMYQSALNAFVFVDERLVETTANYVTKNTLLYSIFDAELVKCPDKVLPFRDMAYIVKERSDQLVYDIQELKAEIIKSCDGNNAPSLTPVEWHIAFEKKSTFDIDGSLILRKGNTKIPFKLIFGKSKGEQLKEEIEKYRDFLVSFIYDPSHQKFIMTMLNTDDRIEKTGIFITWETYYFWNFPMITVIANLSKLQNDIRNAEADILQLLLSEIGAYDFRVNRLEAIVVAKSNYVAKGDEFVARIVLAAYDSLQKPEIWIGPYHRKENGAPELVGEGIFLPYDARGHALYKTTATTVGNFTLQGIIRVLSPDGDVLNYPFSYEYQVGNRR